MAPKRTTDTNAREFTCLEAIRGIMSQAKLVALQTHGRANGLKIIWGYRGAHA